MMIGVTGKQLCAGNPNADGRRTDRRTDGHVDSSIPPNFVAGGGGGYKKIVKFQKLKDILMGSSFVEKKTFHVVKFSVVK